LAWAPPESDGGSPITNYIVEMKKKGEAKWSRVNKKDTVTEPEFTVPSLKEETDYEFRVTAENKAGPGAPSKPSEVTRYGQ
jgi:titin